MDPDSDGSIKIRFDDDGSESRYIHTRDVWVLDPFATPVMEWDDSKHGEGTKVVRKSDCRAGVSTTDRSKYGTIEIRFDDDGSESDWISTGDVWVPES